MDATDIVVDRAFEVSARPADANEMYADRPFNGSNTLDRGRTVGILLESIVWPQTTQERHSIFKGRSRFPRLPPASHAEIRLESPIFSGHLAGVAGLRPTAVPYPV
jgi:hypothetical protein